MPSHDYIILESEIQNLRSHLLPDPFDALGDYDEQQRLLARAYLLLSHAAVETYFETRAKAIVKLAEQIWQSHSRLTLPLVTLACSTERKPSALDSSRPDRSNDRYIQGLIREFYDRISQNHGIKEANIVSLFNPLGLSVDVFGSTLLPTLSSFGEHRGEHAHSSQAVLVDVIDPQTEHDKMQVILNDISACDEKISIFLTGVK